MTAKEVLKARRINPEKSILRIDTEEAIERLLEFIKEWELSIRVDDIKKADWENILGSYSNSIISYHPENDHQERGAFLKSERMLMKYGLTQEDITRLDFC